MILPFLVVSDYHLQAHILDQQNCTQDILVPVCGITCKTFHSIIELQV